MSTSHDFIEAIKAGEIQKVKQMLDRDPALVDARAGNGLSAVLIAAYYNEPEIAHGLAQRRADLDIFEASAAGVLSRVQELIAQQPDLINAYAPDGFQPLGLAAFFGYTSIAEFLLTKGAAVNSPSQNRMRVMPLHSAIANRRTEIVRLLLEHGADVNAAQADDFTPLHEAAQNGMLEVTRWLLDRGANVNAKLTDGKTPLALAVEYKHDDVVELLRRYGATM